MARNLARAARGQPSVVEEIVWEFLRDRRTGFKFRREYPVGPYRIDFYCAEARVGVEFDGEQHDPERDATRDRYLGEAGIAIVRIPNRSFFMLDRDRLSKNWLDTIVAECERRTGRKAF